MTMTMNDVLLAALRDPLSVALLGTAAALVPVLVVAFLHAWHEADKWR